MALADLSVRTSARMHRHRAEVVRADPVTMEEFGYMLGQRGGVGRSKAGIAVGEGTAASIPAWYSGVRYLAEGVGFLPVHTYRDRLGERTRRADPPWLRRPDVELTWKLSVEFVVQSLLNRGNAYLGKLRNDLGQVVGLRVIHPDRVKVGQADNGTKVFSVDRQPYTSREILHVLGPWHNGVVGLDVISAMTDAIGTIKAAENYAASTFGSGDMTQTYMAVPGELTRDQAEELYRAYMGLHSGRDGRRFAVMANGAELRTVSLSPEQTQLLDTRRWSVIVVAQVLRVVPHKLYELSRATFSNIEHQAIESVTDSMQPWVERLEDAFNNDADLLPNGNFIEFAIEGKLRGDIKSRYEAYGAGIRDGWLTPAAAARLENQPAPPELEYWQRPLNVAVVRPGMPEEVQHDQAVPA